MKYTILVFLLTTATNFIATAPVGGQHSAVYQEAHYRLDSPPRSTGGLYGSPAYSFASELGDQGKWMASPYTKYTGGFPHSAQISPWVKDVGVQDTQSHRQYWNPLHTNDGERATWLKEQEPAGDTYVHLYHLSGQGIAVPPNSGVLQDEWTPHSESYHLDASLPQVYDADNGRYAGGWNHASVQDVYSDHSRDSNGGYWTGQVNPGFVPSNNEASGSMYTELLPVQDTWSAYGIDPDLVDWIPVEDVHAYLSEHQQPNPTQETSTFYTDSQIGNPDAVIGQQTTWGDGISGPAIGTGELGSTVTGIDLGGATKTKGSTEINTENLSVGSFDDGVSTTYIDSGDLTGDKGTGIEILGATKVVAGTTGAEFSNGSSDTKREGLADGLREVPGSSVTNNNAGADKFLDSTSTVGGPSDLKEDTAASSMLGGSLGQYDSKGAGSFTESGGAQSGTVTVRPAWGQWSGGSAMESGTGVPGVGEGSSVSGNAVNIGEHSSGTSTTGTSGPKGTEFGSGSATVESAVPQTGNLSSKDRKNSSVQTGGAGDSSLGSSGVQGATSGPFDGYVKEDGWHVTSHGDRDDTGAAVESSGSHVGHDKGSQIGGGIGESSKASSSGGGPSGGNGGKTRTGSGAGCTGNGVWNQQCKNTATGATKAGSAGEKGTDVGIDYGSGHATKISSANGSGKGGANAGNSGSILENGSGSGSSIASETDASNTNLTELVQPLLYHFPDSSVAVAEAFAGIGPDGKLQASSAAKVFDSKSKTHL